MTDRMKLEGQLRTKVGSTGSTQLRKKGQTPAIMYGHKKESVAFSINGHEFTKGLHHGHRLYDVVLDGKAETLLVKDLQYDHLGKDIIHADFMRVNLAEKVSVAVDLEFKGNAAGSLEGGMIDNHASQIEIECLVSQIPETILVSIKEVQVGTALHAGQIELPEGMTLVSDPETLILTCHLVAAAKSTEELEGDMPTAPEVITEKAAPEEEKE